MSKKYEKGQMPLTVPTPLKSNIVRDKYYVFNETGNIMIATTEVDGSQIQEDVRDVFNEVSVFFAGMTKVLNSTPIPNTSPVQYYNIFHYEQMMKIIDNSGLFVQVGMESIVAESQSFSATFSEQLLLGVIGLAVDEELVSFAKSMVSSMGKAGLTISESHQSDTSEVSNIIFVIEYLLGMPIVTTLVIHVDVDDVVTNVKIGPCINIHAQSEDMTINKDSYLFVLPQYIKKYSPDLISGEEDPAYLRFINTLRNAMDPDDVMFNSILDPTTLAPTTTLKNGSKYILLINNLGIVNANYLTIEMVGKTASEVKITPTASTKFANEATMFQVTITIGGTATGTVTNFLTITAPKTGERDAISITTAEKYKYQS